MVELIFETFIGRDIEFVFDNLYKREVFRKWGTAFSDDPKYMGVISIGNTVKFGSDENNAMIGTVTTYIENKQIIITYSELVMEGQSNKFGPGVSEEYDFTISNTGVTLLTVKLNIPEEWADTMKEMWEKGIVNIKHTLEEI